MQNGWSNSRRPSSVSAIRPSCRPSSATRRSTRCTTSTKMRTPGVSPASRKRSTTPIVNHPSVNCPLYPLSAFTCYCQSTKLFVICVGINTHLAAQRESPKESNLLQLHSQLIPGALSRCDRTGFRRIYLGWGNSPHHASRLIID